MGQDPTGVVPSPSRALTPPRPRAQRKRAPRQNAQPSRLTARSMHGTIRAAPIGSDPARRCPAGFGSMSERLISSAGRRCAALEEGRAMPQPYRSEAELLEKAARYSFRARMDKKTAEGPVFASAKGSTVVDVNGKEISTSIRA